jgi:hypothetical protein
VRGKRGMLCAGACGNEVQGGCCEMCVGMLLCGISVFGISCLFVTVGRDYASLIVGASWVVGVSAGVQNVCGSAHYAAPFCVHAPHPQAGSATVGDASAPTHALHVLLCIQMLQYYITQYYITCAGAGSQAVCYTWPCACLSLVAQSGCLQAGKEWTAVVGCVYGLHVARLLGIAMIYLCGVISACCVS